MAESKISILSIAPYKFLPAHSGGHKGIAMFHHYLGMLCNDHIVSTVDNEENNFSFRLHKVFPSTSHRYLPRHSLQKIKKIALENNCTHIICEHPYMSFTAIALSNKLGIPWFSHSHNIESVRFKSLNKPWWRLLHKYERYAMRKANGVFFKTEEDAQWAINNYGITPDKCLVVPFGAESDKAPNTDHTAKQTLGKLFNINTEKPWLYFLGGLNYQPNEDAVQFILSKVLERLKSHHIDVEILIAGKGLNKDLVQQIESIDNVHYLGFVPDLQVFLNACDIMLNPVMTGGGIKTKAIEALEYNNTVVSSEHGAAGISKDACGDKILVTEDHDWDAFTDSIIHAINNPVDTPPSFYEMYYWGNIAKKKYSLSLISRFSN